MPIAVLPFPELFALSVDCPIATLFDPLVMFCIEPDPIATLLVADEVILEENAIVGPIDMFVATLPFPRPINKLLIVPFDPVVKIDPVTPNDPVI